MPSTMFDRDEVFRLFRLQDTDPPEAFFEVGMPFVRFVEARERLVMIPARRLLSRYVPFDHLPQTDIPDAPDFGLGECCQVLAINEVRAFSTGFLTSP